MPDIFDESGLEIKTVSEIVADLEAGFRDIYGQDINLDQNSPDGQLINIFAQAAVDLRELLVQVNNGFNPDRAIGRILDERVVINNIERRGGTFTIQPVDVTVDRTIVFQGLDADFNDINGTGFTVQDNQGNEFILIDSTTVNAGTHSLQFRARNIGRVETTLGTITTPVTIILGVTNIENTSPALEVGQDEETDTQLRVRRQQSVAIASNGYLNGLLAAILNLTGVSDAKVYENFTSVTDSDGIPPHSTWLIVEGGANSDIADVYFSKKSFGSGMKGAVEVNITTESGAIFTAKFDRPEAKDLYIRFEIQPTAPAAVFDQNAIKEYIVENAAYGIGDFAETSFLTKIAREAIIETGGQGVAINLEVSDDDMTWLDFIDVDTLDEKWVLDTSRITITEL